jgi:PPP family 3-phenylpropionic acid transporter
MLIHWSAFRLLRSGRSRLGCARDDCFKSAEMAMNHTKRQLHWRLSLFFFATFLVPGVQLPYWPVWLKSRGFGAEQVGALLFAYALGRVVAAPLIGALADHLGARRRILRTLCLLLIPVTALHALAASYATQLLLHVLAGFLIAAVVPLTDNMTLLAERARGVDYGQVRAWGSKGFIAASLVCGVLISGSDGSPVLPILLVAMSLMLLAAWALPDIRTESPANATVDVDSPHPLASLPHLLRDRTLLLGIAVSGLVQGSHAVLYAFATLHWRAAGHNEAVIGALWTEGVIAEIALFYVAARWLGQWSAARLMALGAMACLLRWAALAHTDQLAALVMLQLLHAFSFGATHLGAMRLLRESVPASRSASAQTLHAAIVGGLFMGGGFWLAGYAWARLGSQAFLLMVLPAGLGLLAAWRLELRLLNRKTAPATSGED